MNLTTKEAFILVFAIIILGVILSSIFKSAIKLIVAGMLILSMWVVGFEWLPYQIDRIKNGDATVDQIVDEVVNDYNESGIGDKIDDTINSGTEWVNQNKEGWIEAAQSLLHKLFNPTTPEPEESDNSVTNNDLKND